MEIIFNREVLTRILQLKDPPKAGGGTKKCRIPRSGGDFRAMRENSRGRIRREAYLPRGRDDLWALRRGILQLKNSG